MDTKQASCKFNIGAKEIQEMCRRGLIVGVRKEKRRWVIPDDTKFIVDSNGIKYIIWEIINLQINKNYAFSLKYIETVFKAKECFDYLQLMGYITSFTERETVEETIASVRLSQRAMEELRGDKGKEPKMYFCKNFSLVSLKGSLI